MRRASLVKAEQVTGLPSPVMDRQPTVASGLTLRAVMLGMVLSIFLTIWAIQSSYVTHASFISVTHLPVAALFPFVFVVLILNPLLKALFPQRALNRQELIIVFFLVFTASAIPGWAFSTYAISVISGPFYFASPENRWGELFLDYLAPWLVVPNHNGALTLFFEGLPGDQPLPWQVWVVPLFWWSTFYLAIFLVGASIMVMLRKQWVEHERLTFPLAQVPLMLVEGTDEGYLLPRIARNRLFWWAFGITLGILGWNMIGYFGRLPAIPLGPSHSMPFTLFRAFPTIQIKFNFLLAGVAYFTRIEVLLSVWFFYLIRIIQQGAMNRLGVPQAGQVIQFQHLAGFLVFVLFSLWIARKHLRQVFWKAFGRAPQVDDAKEFFSYRKAVGGLIFGLLYMVFWLHSAGLSLGLVVLMLGILLLMYLGITRVVAETGLVSLDLPYNSANEITVRFLGSANISRPNLATLSLCHTFARNWRTLGMCSIGHAAKVGDQMGGVGKGVFGTIALTLALSFVTAIIYTLYLGYADGAFQFTEPAFPAGARSYWNGLVNQINNAESLTSLEFLFFCFGALFTLVLVLGHHRLPWWPLHPVGFGIVTTHSANMGVFSIFLVWLIKVVLFKVGGVQLYRKVQPAVIGMLVAYAIGVFLSFLVDQIWFPGSGHVVDDW